MTLRVLALGLIGACAPEPSSKPGEVATDTGSAPTDLQVAVDTAAAPAADSGADTADDGDVPAIFSNDVIHEVAITLSDDAITALLASPYDWVEAGAILDDDEMLDPIGLRLRGKVGSFRPIDEKPKFKLDFNHYNSGQRFEGLKTLALNNEVVDCSYLREATGYAVFRQLGLPSPRTSYAHVTVNGEDYGLYVVVEFPDSTFLKRTFSDSSGNLYDGKYLWFGGNDYALADFDPDLQDNFELEEGDDVAYADIYAVTAALGAITDDFDSTMDPTVDLAAFHRFEVAEEWIGQVDGYAMNDNNYRVYFDPGEEGRVRFIPWDLDYAFYEARTWGMSWKHPRGAVAKACWRDPTCKANQGLAVEDARSLVDTDALLAQIDAWTALTTDAATADPKRECRARKIPSSQADVRDWIANADTDMATFWNLDD